MKKEEKIPEKLSAIEFAGFIGIEDSPRMEVGEAVAKVKSANIRLVMITGDHKSNRQNHCQKIGNLGKWRQNN